MMGVSFPLGLGLTVGVGISITGRVKYVLRAHTRLLMMLWTVRHDAKGLEPRNAETNAKTCEIIHVAQLSRHLRLLHSN
jgi:hypothetical protein